MPGVGRPTHLSVLSNLAVQMWAPVFKTLSEEEKQNLANLPYNESLYRAGAHKGAEVLADLRVKKPKPIPPSQIRWIEAIDIDRIHDRLIREYGGDLGVRHPTWVASIIDRAQHSTVMGKDTMPTIFDKAAHVMREICVQHPYLDGQKRTGLAAAFIFLGLNGYALWSRNQTDEVHYAMKVAQGEKSTADVSRWLANRVGPLHIGRGNASIVRMLGGAAKTPRCHSCGRFVSILANFGFCTKSCGLVYEVRARALGFARRGDSDHIEAKIGLHKIGEELTAEPDKSYRFRLTDPSVFNLKLEKGIDVGHVVLKYSPKRSEGSQKRLDASSRDDD